MSRPAKAQIDPPMPEIENPKVRQIFNAARKFLIEENYDTSSMDSIAQAAGLSKATLYAYFASKEELLLAVAKEEFRVPATLWEPTLRPIDLEQGLWGIARAFAALILQDRALTVRRMVASYGRRFPEIAEMFLAAGPRKHHAEIVAFLRAAQAQGLLVAPDIDLAATQLVSLLLGDLPLKSALCQKMPSQAEYEAIAAGAIRVFLAAYASRKEASAAIHA